MAERHRFPEEREGLHVTAGLVLLQEGGEQIAAPKEGPARCAPSPRAPRRRAKQRHRFVAGRAIPARAPSRRASRFPPDAEGAPLAAPDWWVARPLGRVDEEEPCGSEDQAEHPRRLGESEVGRPSALGIHLLVTSERLHFDAHPVAPQVRRAHLHIIEDK